MNEATPRSAHVGDPPARSSAGDEDVPDDAIEEPDELTSAGEEGEGGAWEPGKRWRIAALTALLLVGLVYLWQASLLPYGTMDQPGHGFYPRFAGALFVLPLIGVLVVEIRARTERSGSEGSWAKPLIVLMTVLAYFLVAPLLGHMASSVIVVGVVLRVVGTRPWWQILTIALGCAVGSQLLLATLLGLPLPAGRLGLTF
ncbi:tripartite tricarboxylate transporter TctB family protein [Ruania alba]|uniref:tripartite tricarboxylate transporter TctB family protein n=1 Tax=Ruania alba TaxID=648782 RepID=UPI000B7F9AA0|nr:tripartite tricarboxylate transporter TctB family protein [Ruania alba]